MVKFRYLLITAICVLFVCGCGNKGKMLTCEQKGEAEGIKMSETISMRFSDNKINYLEMKIETKATNDEAKEHWDLISGSYDDEYNKLNKRKGIDISVSNKNYTYIVDIKADLNKASKEDLEELELNDIVNSNYTMEQAGSDMENSGFTCK